jgi:hypothetical protein
MQMAKDLNNKSVEERRSILGTGKLKDREGEYQVKTQKKDKKEKKEK